MTVKHHHRRLLQALVAGSVLALAACAPPNAVISAPRSMPTSELETVVSPQSGPVVPELGDPAFADFPSSAVGILEDDVLDVCGRTVPLPASGSRDDLDKASDPLVSDYANMIFISEENATGEPETDITFSSFEFVNEAEARAGWTRLRTTLTTCTSHDDAGEHQTVSADPVLPPLSVWGRSTATTSFTTTNSGYGLSDATATGALLRGRYVQLVTGTAPAATEARELALRAWRWQALHLPVDR